MIEVNDLNDYAVQTRYPGDHTPIGEEEYVRAIALAERCYDWAKRIIGEKQ